MTIYRAIMISVCVVGLALGALALIAHGIPASTGADVL